MRKAQRAILHEYYVYIYLDPRRSGKYKYGDLEFDFLPFYVGKGMRNRYKQHLFEKRLQKNSHKNNILKKILKNGFDPLDFVLIYKDELTEEEALTIEKEIIAKIGCTFLESGPLVNKTTGGESPTTCHKGLTYEEIYGEEKAKILKKNRSERFSGEKNPMYGKEGTFKGKTFSEESKRKLSEANSKPILQFSTRGDFIKEFRSAREAEKETGIKYSLIKNCSSTNYKKAKTAGGFVFLQKEDYKAMSEVERIDRFQNCLKRNSTDAVKIIQIDKKTGELIKTWDSISEAAKFLTGKKSTVGDISEAIKRNGCSCGFKWKLVDK
jgi:hypothetical protein